MLEFIPIAGWMLAATTDKQVNFEKEHHDGRFG
jgi:hypothetical protein